MCYVEVADDGAVTWGREGGSYERALAGKSRLYAVWPGQWSSHLFVIDDLAEYARAFGIVHDEERTGLAQHVHDVRWSISPREDKSASAYVTSMSGWTVGARCATSSRSHPRCASRRDGI
jgi:hypothetical protein